MYECMYVKCSLIDPQILRNLCFSFLLGITAIPREIETMLMRNFVGQIRCVMGDVEVANAQHTEYTMKSF